MNTNLKNRLKHAGKIACAVFLITISVLHTNILLENKRVQLIAAELEKDTLYIRSQTFQDFMVYSAIIPANDPVVWGSTASWKSALKIVKIPKNGRLPVGWSEHIECDHNPDIGTGADEEFEYYRPVQYTEYTYTKIKDNSDLETLKNKKGYESILSGTDKIITYPNHDADCRLVSTMTQKHRHGEYKVFQLRSEIVHVRKKVINEEK